MGFTISRLRSACSDEDSSLFPSTSLEGRSYRSGALWLLNGEVRSPLELL